MQNQQNQTNEQVYGNKDKFFLNPKLKHLNHASYGAVSKYCSSKIEKINLEVLTNPDKFIWHREFEKFWNPSVTALADYLNVSENNIFLAESVTDGLNAAYKLVEFNAATDAILVNGFSYTDMNDAIDYEAKSEKINGEQIPVFQAPMIYPLLDIKQVVDSFDATCREIVEVRKLRIRFAIIDHITSLNGLMLPVKEICQVIRKWQAIWKKNQSKCFADESEYKTYILIDGAHAFGQVKITLNDYDCDFYASCLHKWFYSPWGCAFLYTKTDKMKSVEPKFAYNKYKIPFHNFAEPATRNESLRLVYNDYIDFIENHLGGLANTEAYAKELQSVVLPMLVSSWKSKTQQIARELEAPFVKCVELPAGLQHGYNRDELIDLLREKYNISTLFNRINGIMYCRISFAVYNKLEDYFALNDAILDLVKDNENNKN